MSRGDRRTEPPLPDFVGWQTFPFEGQFRLKPVDPPVGEEPPRQGERGENCAKCAAPDSEYIWVDERWRVRALSRPSGLPAVVVLETRHHYDLGDLSNLLAAELGVLTVRLERGIRSISGVARVHVNRWGDGSEHLHVFFLARPKGMLQLRGTFLSMWDDILPPISERQWRENLAFIAAWLADYGGEAIAEPPPLDWDDVSGDNDSTPADRDLYASVAGAELGGGHVGHNVSDSGPTNNTAGGSAVSSGTTGGGQRGSGTSGSRPSLFDETPKISQSAVAEESVGVIRAVGVASVTSMLGGDAVKRSDGDETGISRRRRVQERLEATQRLRSR